MINTNQDYHVNTMLKYCKDVPFCYHLLSVLEAQAIESTVSGVVNAFKDKQ